MAKIKKTNAIPNAKKNRVATSPEARENQLISLAVDLAEQHRLKSFLTFLSWLQQKKS